MNPSSVPGPTGSPNCATFSRPGEPSMARCTSSGRADRDVSGSRSLRTTTYEIPCRARVSASPADGRPAANRRCTESRARMVSGGVSGIESRTPHALSPSTCSGSSWLLPHTWVANGAPGATSTRPPVVVFVEPVGGVVPVLRDRVERARRGEPARPGQRGRRGQRDQHDDADRHPLVAFGMGERIRHTARGALPGSGMRPSRCASPSASGSRSSGSSLWMLRSGVPPASRNA